MWLVFVRVVVFVGSDCREDGSVWRVIYIVGITFYLCGWCVNRLNKFFNDLMLVVFGIVSIISVLLVYVYFCKLKENNSGWIIFGGRLKVRGMFILCCCTDGDWMLKCGVVLTRNLVCILCCILLICSVLGVVGDLVCCYLLIWLKLCCNRYLIKLFG